VTTGRDKVKRERENNRTTQNHREREGGKSE